MAILLKNLQKSLSNLRFNNLSRNNHNHKLLLKRFVDVDTPYLSVLSPQDFSFTKHIHLPHFEEFRTVVGSCNGLVCLDNTLDKFLVCNPSTGDSNIISSRRFPSTLKKHSFSSGFGYDSNSKHFKLVRFIYYFEPDLDDLTAEDRYRLGTQVIELYDVNSDSWRYIDHPEPGNFVLRNPSVYVNGHNYWLAYFKDAPYILSFNFTSEELSALHLPDLGKTLSLKGSSLHFDFLEFKGGISVIVHPKFGTEEKSFGIWIRNGDAWIKEYEFCVPGAQRPLGFADNDRLLLFEGMNGQLIACDIDTQKTTMKLDIYDSSGKMQLFPYVQSDVSVKGLLGTAKTSPVNMEQMSMLSSNSDSIISSLTQKISSFTRWRG